MPGVGYKPDLTVAGPLARSPGRPGIGAVADRRSDARGFSRLAPQAAAGAHHQFHRASAGIYRKPTFSVDTEVQDRIQAVADFFVKNGAKVNPRPRVRFGCGMSQGAQWQA